VLVTISDCVDGGVVGVERAAEIMVGGPLNARTRFLILLMDETGATSVGLGPRFASEDDVDGP
jgi:6-phosphogluconate dehydrogenase (decarboxylating)